MLNAIYVPLYGYVAAAYTTLASYVVLLILHFYITRRILKVRLYDDRFMFVAIFATFLLLRLS